MSVFTLQAVNENSIIPKWTKDKAYVIYSNEDIELMPNVPVCVKSGFRMVIPKEYCGIIVSYGDVKLLGGLIDSDYRGEVSCIACSPVKVSIKRGEPLGSMHIIEILLPEIEDLTPPLLKESKEPTDENQ